MGGSALIWLAACIIGAPAVLGLFTVRLARGTLDGELFGTPVGVAIGLSLVCAVSAAAILEPKLQQLIGPWVIYTGAFAVVTFIVGLFIGWAEARGGG